MQSSQPITSTIRSSRLREEVFLSGEPLSTGKGPLFADFNSQGGSVKVVEAGSKQSVRGSCLPAALAASLTIFTSSQYDCRVISVAAFSTIFTGSLGILTTLSKDDGVYKYDYATIPFLAEVTKFLVCALLLWKECRWSRGAPPRMTTEWRTVRLYPIPSMIYLIHNNVQFATLSYLDPSTYQILGNLKIVTTGIMFRCFLKRKLSRLQWMALVLLTVGTTTSQINCGQGVLSAPIQGYLLAVLSACLSALAGVYTEFLMKKNDDSLYWQNLQLYSFGVLFNMLRLSADDAQSGFEKGLWWQRLTHGYDYRTWLVVFNLGFTGLLVSWIMKFADNIVKVYATSMAMLLTMLLSIYLFDFHPSLQLFMGVVICGISLQLYFTPQHMMLDSGPDVEKGSKPPLTSLVVASKLAS